MQGYNGKVRRFPGVFWAGMFGFDQREYFESVEESKAAPSVTFDSVMATSNFLSDQEQANILAAISDAESHTSGEIRLHLESRCRGDVLDRAAVVFETLAMHKTSLRNGVLFYLATEDRKFAILGDGGIMRPFQTILE